MSVGGLGRRPAVDARDLRHLMSAAMPTTLPVRPKRKTYRLDWRGDQKQTSRCVGFGMHALLRCKPVLQRDPKPDYIYRKAQENDEWPGEAYEGTSVRAGAKVLQAEGKIVSYGWEFSLPPALAWLGANKGPIVAGTNWYATMNHPDPETGLVRVGGPVEGGHCFIWIGYDDQREEVICQNSWGKSWGINGRFRLKYADADRLIREDGECCTITEAVSV